MTEECPIFFVNPSDVVGEVSEPPADPTTCVNGCNCGYIQFENLLPYLDELKSLMKWDKEASDELEMRLREQIIEISRLFDIQCGVDYGYFAKSHYQTTQVYSSNGTKYIKIPEFVPGTLEVRTMENHVIAPSAYGVQDGFLVHYPCTNHGTCGTCGISGCYYGGCSSSCGTSTSTREARRRMATKWKNGCYQVTARWGKDCTDLAVQMAVRDYLIETYRVQDPVVLASTGLPVSRTFKVPHAWATYVANFKAKRDLYSRFAFA